MIDFVNQSFENVNNCSFTNNLITGDDNFAVIYKDFMMDYLPEFMTNFADGFQYNPWIFSTIASTIVGFSGVLPLLVIPVNAVDDSNTLKGGDSAKTLQILLSFAVGGLLGDVFLHLLPEAWETDIKNSVSGHPSMFNGIMVLIGMLVFICVEKVISAITDETEVKITSPVEKINNNTKKLIRVHSVSTINEMLKDAQRNGFVKQKSLNGFKNGATIGALNYSTNGVKKNLNGLNKAPLNGFDRSLKLEPTNGFCPVHVPDQIQKPKKVAGYLNLLANSIDNFTHGLAVGGSFLISLRLGALTTFAILIHEIPHEVGDFAILLQSGFSRWDAARAQLMTASAGLFGSLLAVSCSGGSSELEGRTSWILPFTAGGFLHIALVTVLPDLLKEDNPVESVKQFLALILGIVIMAFLTALTE